MASSPGREIPQEVVRKAIAGLRWCRADGQYAEALVAAESEEQALGLVEKQYYASIWAPWCVAVSVDDLPGPPTVAGVYHMFGE